ncbi:hypothetical protein Moror_7667 [Moniliophthora roreri MCA 2997]|nr:hypothetical protein Moror_7667 [Moniliophthora roreri MCA 2997]
MVPEDWITVHVAKSKGALFARVSNVLYAYDDGPEVLLEDIRDGTRNTVMQNWINEDDLVHLKSLLKERAKIFGIPLRPRTIETRGTKRKRK